MATLQTIRNRGGLLVSIVIGLALIAFIVGDALNSGSRIFNSQRNQIGEIAGEGVSIIDFQNRVSKNEEMIKAMNNVSSLNEEQQTMLRENTWQQMIMEQLMQREYDEIGIDVSGDELYDALLGENMSPALRQLFTNPNTGEIDYAGARDYVKKVISAPNNIPQKAYWLNMEKEVSDSRKMAKYNVATGGAAGLYRPNNPGFSRHKMWYPPFNTGAGYAMGINAGAEMTTFEMRFIALRCKDTIAPTGTIAQGVPAKQLNSNGEVYENKYGLTTSQRLYGTVTENREGRGPCYLGTKGISREQEEDLYKAYLNMAPSQTLKWLEAAGGPSEENVEIEGTEPYIVGGHTASGYWVDNNRETTIHGLFAAGDVAGGCPQKYVTGALAEGEIAAQAIAERLEGSGKGFVVNEVADSELSANAFAKKSEYERFLNNKQGLVDIEQTEEAMQKIMDQYAGGISTDYQYNETRLELADEKIKFLEQSIDNLAAQDADDLLRIYEIRERLTVCRSVIAHLKARKETRWHSFAENMDYPAKSDDWLKYVNSRKENGEIKIIIRDLVRGGDSYEHSDK